MILENMYTLWKNNEFTVTFPERFFRLTHYCGPHYKCYKTKNCYWSVREDGFYFSDDQQN
ncbi:hypothetical protein ACOSP7_006324 [Xanthoceras sorbifolium]